MIKLPPRVDQNRYPRVAIRFANRYVFFVIRQSSYARAHFDGGHFVRPAGLSGGSVNNSIPMLFNYFIIYIGISREILYSTLFCLKSLQFYVLSINLAHIST